MKGMHITSGMVKNGAVLFAATFAGVQGFKAGCRGFEKLVPEVINKITVGRAVVSALSDSDDDDDDDYDDEDE